MGWGSGWKFWPSPGRARKKKSRLNPGARIRPGPSSREEREGKRGQTDCSHVITHYIDIPTQHSVLLCVCVCVPSPGLLYLSPTSFSLVLRSLNSWSVSGAVVMAVSDLFTAAAAADADDADDVDGRGEVEEEEERGSRSPIAGRAKTQPGSVCSHTVAAVAVAVGDRDMLHASKRFCHLQTFPKKKIHSTVLQYPLDISTTLANSTFWLETNFLLQ